MPTSGRPLPWVSEAIRSCRELDGRVSLVLERRRPPKQQQQQQGVTGRNGDDSRASSVFDPSLFD